MMKEIVAVLIWGKALSWGSIYEQVCFSHGEDEWAVEDSFLEISWQNQEI